MKAPKVKATLVDTYEDARFEERRWVGNAWELPADADSYERMVKQMAEVFAIEIGTAYLRGCMSVQAVSEKREDYAGARAALRAIGITAPKRGKKGTQ